MDALGDNLANLNTVRSTDEAAFQARDVVAEAVDYGSAGVSGVGTGSRVAGIEYGTAEGRLVHQPDHPLADEDGMVRMPDIAMATQMTPLIQAQRGYQANLARSEARRVGKECVSTCLSRGSTYQYKKTQSNYQPTI